MTSRTLTRPLIDTLVPVRADALRIPLQIALGVVFLALLAQVRLELGAVPFTGQTLGVLLIGAAYGASLGTLTLVSYLAVGALGLPVFTGGAYGLSTLTGVTAGYLVGFVIAAGVVGYLAQRGWDKSYSKTALAMLVGNVIIYVPGLWWLNRIMPDFNATLAAGFLPFVPGDIIKLLIAAALLPTAWKLLGKE